MRKLGLHLCALALIAIGCNEEDETTSGGTETALDEVEEKGAEATGDDDSDGAPDSCTVLTEELVRDHFDLAADVEVAQSTLDVAHHTCTYKWDKPNAEDLQKEAEKQRQEAIQKMMADMRKNKKAQGMMDLVADMPSTENRVSLTLPDFHFDDAAAARKGFRKSMKRLAEGIKKRVEEKGIDEEVEFKMKTEPVEGVGDEAMWSARMSQLSVVEGKRIFHAMVEIHEDDEENLEAAKKLAARIAKAL